VVEALHRTSMTPGAAAMLVMERLHRRKPVPADCRGVWTDDDDEGLRAGRAQGLQQLELKHGRPSVELRMAYLDAMDAEFGG